MRAHVAIILLLLVACILPAQDTADIHAGNLVTMLEKAVDTNTHWELREETDIPREHVEALPYKAILSLPYYTDEKLVRYHSVVRIPEVFAGQKVKAGKATLEFSLSGPADYQAEVFVNGEKAASWPQVDPSTRAMAVPPLLLSGNAAPGDTFDVEVRVFNPRIYPAFNYPLSSQSTSFGGARLVLHQVSEEQAELERFLINIYAAHKLTSPWKPNERDRRPFVPERESRSRLERKELLGFKRLLNTAVDLFDQQALATGDWAAVQKSIATVMAEIEPISAFAKSFTIYLVGNAHIDLAWLWRTNESVEIAANTFKSVMNNMREFPDMTYAQSQAQAYQWVKENRPEVFEAIKEKIADGNWDVVGGMWAEPDCNLIGGESWIRQIIYAQDFFEKNFGVSASLGWNPDSFGYNWNMPQFYSKSGIKAFITQKISWNKENRFPYHLFWWEAPDGSRILTYLPTGSYVEKVEFKPMLNQLLNFEHASGFRDVLCLIGFGNHGGGPNIPMLERAELYNSLPMFPKVEFIKAHDYIDMLFARDLSDLPVWKSEMYLENHRGTLTTQAKTKEYNRKLEIQLVNTEKLASIASMHGYQYPASVFEKAWKTLLLNQFHDILPGSSITPVYHDAEEEYAAAMESVKDEMKSIVSFMTANLKTDSGEGELVTVFNPESWRRGGRVRLELPARSAAHFTVKELSTGEVVPAEVFSDQTTGKRMLEFLVPPLPANGLARFEIISRPGAEAEKQSEVDQFTIENEYLRVDVNPETGNISSIFSKVLNRETLAEGMEANQIQLLENLPDFWDAWNIGYTGRQWTVDTADEVSLLENNELRSVIRVKKSFLGLSKANAAPTEGFPSSFFVQDIILYKHSPLLEVEMHIDWWEDHTLLKVAFPFAVDSDVATYEIPYASIERSTRRETSWEKARYEVAVHRWADISEQDWGISLINDRKYGMDVQGGTMRLTLLTSPMWPDPQADRGRQYVRYAVYPHAGGWRQAETVHQAAAFNSPLVAVFPEARRPLTMAIDGGAAEESGALPSVSLGTRQAMITALKQSHDGTSFVLRLVELHGEACETEIRFDFPVKEAWEVNLAEEPLSGRLEMSEGVLPIRLKPFEIKSIAFTVKKGAASETAE